MSNLWRYCRWRTAPKAPASSKSPRTPFPPLGEKLRSLSFSSFPHRTHFVGLRRGPLLGGWPCVSKVWGIVPQRSDFVSGFRLETAGFLDMEQSVFAHLNQLLCINPSGAPRHLPLHKGGFAAQQLRKCSGISQPSDKRERIATPVTSVTGSH